MIHTRRTFLRTGGAVAAALAGGFAKLGSAQSQNISTAVGRRLPPPVLTIGYEESGNSANFPVILLHGFPDDVRAWTATCIGIGTCRASWQGNWGAS